MSGNGMKRIMRWCGIVMFAGMLSPAWAAQGTNSPYSDAVGDIDPGIATGGGTLDIISMEVSNNAADVFFSLALNGDVTTTDWGKFLIGIATENTAGTDTGNGWGRPINLDSPGGGMDFWLGSWVDGGGGCQLWQYTNSSWAGPATATFTFSGGATSKLSFAVPLATLGLSVHDTFYFDAYSSGGGGSDSAVDALANPNVSITSWSQTYTSKTTGESGVGLNSYTVAGPTRVVLYDFYLQERNSVFMVCWQTASEEESVGFDVYREQGGAWVKVNAAMIAAQGWPDGGRGASYCIEDAGANATDTFRYKLVEHETDGGVQEYGPFDAAVSHPRLENLAVSSDGMVLRWLSRAQDTYEVQRAYDLKQPFQSIATDIPATPPANTYTDRVDHAGSAYYRIRVE